MILDLLPWKKPRQGRYPRLGLLRYVHFALSVVLVVYAWLVLGIQPESLRTSMELYWFAAGNLMYYLSGFILAAVFRDNRAFCKYLCPIPVLQKPGTPFSILKIKINTTKCVECRLCEKNCPMGIKLLDYKRQDDPILSTECIACMTCSDVCPESAIDWKPVWRVGLQEHLNTRCRVGGSVNDLP